MGEAADSSAATRVDAREEVCRLCFSASIPISRDQKHPNQVDADTGMIRLEEIGWDDMKFRGFSLQRRHLYSLNSGLEEAARREAAKRLKDGDVSYELAGVLIAKVQLINAIEDSAGNQVFRVLATPSESQPGHSEIRIADHLTRKDLLKYRVKLRDALGKLREPSELDAA